MSQGARGSSTPALSSPYPNTGARQTDISKVFLSQTNYARVLQPLREQYERRLNKDELPDDIDKRIQKTLQHYMNEVLRVNGNSVPITQLNQEAFRETALNIDGWFQKQVSTPVQRPTYQSQAAQDPLYENINSRFEREQQSRAPAPTQQVNTIDFSIPKSEDDDEDPLEKYERVRKQREAEARLSAATAASSVPTPKTRNIIESSQYSEPSAASPTTILPPLQQNNPTPPALLAPRPQEYIIKQEDVVKYKENEYNLFIYSGDRDWIQNKNENRYNFTINFNPANNVNTSTYSPSVNQRFKNIVRMELVKAIVSAESLEVSIRVNSGATDTSRVNSVLSYPYLMIRLSEWTGNGFGTNAKIDDTFGLIQYDQTWKSDNAAGNFGYISMTPRYLKAQRVYQPTPLATLQKLSIQVERPDGEPLTRELDTLDLNNIYFAASCQTSVYSTIPDTSSYIFLKLNSYFSRFFVAESDRIQIRGYDVGTDVNVTAQMANDLNTFINRDHGHIVVGTGYSASTTAPFVVTDGPNAVGYANYIIIRSRFADPTTGSTARNYFGNTSANETLIKTRLQTNTALTACAVLNTNRQSHFVLRIITRDMDPTSNLRPDNT
jgi:hypothetical protein